MKPRLPLPSFWYTLRGGIGPLPRALVERVRHIHFERTVEQIEIPGKRVKSAVEEILAARQRAATSF